MTPKQRLHAAIAGKPHDRAPVTPIVMAWAAHFIGRTYRDYYLDHCVLSDAQIRAAQTLGTDQVSAISDPWREAEGYGMKLDYPPEGVGHPQGYILQSPEDVARLGPLDPTAVPRMQDRLDGVAAMARRVGRDYSVLGWVEGPLAEYADLRGVESTMMDLIEDPAAFHRAAEIIVENAITFAAAQIQRGADIIGVGDAVVSLISPDLYVEHVLPWHKTLFAGIHAQGGLIKLHICGNIRALVPHLATTGADVIDLDWMVPIAEARQQVGPDVCFCGNFDPTAVLLQGTPQTIAAAARRNLAEGGERFILQPGCEVPPGTPLANVQAFCPGDGCLIADVLAR